MAKEYTNAVCSQSDSNRDRHRERLATVRLKGNQVKNMEKKHVKWWNHCAGSQKIKAAHFRVKTLAAETQKWTTVGAMWERQHTLYGHCGHIHPAYVYRFGMDAIGEISHFRYVFSSLLLFLILGSWFSCCYHYNWDFVWFLALENVVRIFFTLVRALNRHRNIQRVTLFWYPLRDAANVCMLRLCIDLNTRYFMLFK